jgi:hypothetical protein
MALHLAETKGASRPVLAAAALLGLVAALAGCSMPQPQPQPQPQLAAPQAPPAPPRLEPSGRAFYFNQDGDSASLAYGRANSDDVDLMLQCQKGSRDIQIIDVAHVPPQAKGAVVLTLISGEATSDLEAQLGPDETGQTLANTHAPIDLPAFTGFRKTGVISVRLGGRLSALTASPGELIGVAKFFAVCERR